MFVSYAQNFEDVMLWRALKNVERGSYIDIGAQDPVSDSVSKAFHGLGWSGVHVEPTAKYARLLREQREGDTVLQAIVGPRSAKTVFYEIEDTGLSTTVAELAERHASNEFKIATKEVESIALDELLDMHEGSDVHWLKIDTEGSAASVLGSWASSIVRPWIIVVESVDPITHEINSDAWEAALFARGYALAYFDGVNKFYVSEQHAELLPKFATPLNLFDGFTLSGQASSPFVVQMPCQNEELLAQTQELSTVRAKLEEALVLERERLQVTLQQNEAERGRLHAQLEDQAAWWSAQVEASRAQLAAFHRSTSWRITAPLRSVSRARLAKASLSGRMVSILRRAVIGLVHRLAHSCRRHFPGLFYRLATNRITRSIFDIVPKPQNARPMRGEPTTVGPVGQYSGETLSILMASASLWKSGKRIDA